MSWRIPYIVSPEDAKDTRRYFKIPVSILEIVLKENLFAPFRFFMYCKTVSNGQMRIGTETIQLAAADLGISERTVKRHLVILRNRNWIGRFTSGGYIIRSFDRLREIEKVGGRSAIWVDAKQHLKSFREFVIGACLGHLVNKQRTKLWRDRHLPGSRRGKPNERKRPLPTFFPIACEAMKQIYGISQGTAFNWKQEAQEVGFITIKKTLRPVTAEWVEWHPQYRPRLVVRDNQLFIKYPDKIRCNLKFSRRRCLHALDKK